MTVVVEAGEIRLSGRCGVEEAEALLRALADAPESRVVLAAERIHTAIWQVLLALRPRVAGAAPDPFSARHLLPLLARPEDEP